MGKSKKVIVFYGNDGNAAKDKHPPADVTTYQIIQAEAYQGERLEADEYEFADDVSPGERDRIKKIWGKFDNRTHNPGGQIGSTSIGGVERTPASDRRNLDPSTRVDRPEDVKATQLEKPGVVGAPGDGASFNPSDDKKGVGLDQTTGFKATSRNTIPRGDDKSK